MKTIKVVVFVFAVLLINPLGAQDNNGEKIKVVTSDSDIEGTDKLKSKINEDLKAMENTPPILKDAQRQAKLDPTLADESWPYYKQSELATNRFHTPDKLISKTIPILNEPGQDSQVIEVAMHYGVTISFKNTNGESLFIQRYKEGNKEIINVDDGNDSDGESESEVSSFLTLTHKNKVGATNMHVWLVDSRSSLSFYVKLVDNPKVYADRIDYIVVEPGNDSVGEKLSLNGFDELTMVLNNRKPVDDATKIKFSDDSVTGWAKGDMMWLRTAERLLFPTHNPSMAISSDTVQGMNVYYVSRHPIIHVVDDGNNIRKLVVSGEVN